MGSSILNSCCENQPQVILNRQSRLSKIPYDHLSTSGLFTQRNFRFDLFFGNKYLGQGIHGSTILIFSKDNKSQKYAEKIVPVSKLTEDYAFMHLENIKQASCSMFIDIKMWIVENKKLYIIMEYMQIGNLAYHIKQNESSLDEQNIRQICHFSTQILKMIHNQGMICRNLRPQNILIANKQGTLVFSELLFCVTGQTLHNYRGCTSYTPPQVFLCLETQGYNKSIDIWMLGVMLYQIYFGVNPFDGATNQQIQEKITIFSPNKLDFKTKQISDDLKNLIELMLNPEPKQRITLQQIQMHDFICKQKITGQWHQVSLPQLKNKGQKQQYQPVNRLIYQSFTSSQIYDINEKYNHFFGDDL